MQLTQSQYWNIEFWTYENKTFLVWLEKAYVRLAEMPFIFLDIKVLPNQTEGLKKMQNLLKIFFLVITYLCKEVYLQCASLTRGNNPPTKLIVTFQEYNNTL